MRMRIGVVSDTLGLFDRSLLQHFSGVDRILLSSCGYFCHCGYLPIQRLYCI